MFFPLHGTSAIDTEDKAGVYESHQTNKSSGGYVDYSPRRAAGPLAFLHRPLEEPRFAITISTRKPADRTGLVNSDYRMNPGTTVSFAEIT